MIKAVIVEDDDSVVARIKNYLSAWADKHDEHITVTRYADAETFLTKYTPDFDVAFMDIELKEMDGMTAAHRLREVDKKVLIVFVTNLAQYAIEGYSVDAFDFVVKPVSYANFELKLNRIYDNLQARRGGEIVISQRTGKRVLSVKEIMYVEVERHVLLFHMRREVQQCSGTLKSVSEQLAAYPFALCNQCYLVNLNYVDAIDGNYVEVAGDRLLISKPRKKEFLQAVAKFLGRGGGGVV